jgi:hypothetical protein
VTAIFRIEALAAFPIMIEGEFDVPWRGEAAWGASAPCHPLVPYWRPECRRQSIAKSGS